MCRRTRPSSSARPTRAPRSIRDRSVHRHLRLREQRPAGDLPVRARRRLVHELPERRRLLRSRRGRAPAPRPRGGRHAHGRRVAGGVALDRRPRRDAAGDDDHQPQRRPDRGRLRGHRQLHRRRAVAGSSPARSQPFEQCESPMESQRPAAGQPSSSASAPPTWRRTWSTAGESRVSVGIDTVAPETTILDRPAQPDDRRLGDLPAPGGRRGRLPRARDRGRARRRPGLGGCSTRPSTSSLSRDYTFRVRAVDLALNVDPTPAVWTSTYEPPAPTPRPRSTGRRRTPRRTSTRSSSSRPSARQECECSARRRAVRELRDALPDRADHAGPARLPGPAQSTSTATSNPSRRGTSGVLIAPPLEPTIESTPPDPSPGRRPHLHVLLDRAERHVRMPHHAEPVPEQPVRAVLVAAHVHEPAGRRLPVPGARGQRVRHRR